MESLPVRILTLEKVIEVKEAAGADKDRYGLRILRRVLEERDKASKSEE
ncbi:MAG TPA: hypothetical protein VLU25_11995 [Acidobacteriota bacterium]|nr:hypothetical protein [Acidobacteriota bacterium]